MAEYLKMFFREHRHEVLLFSTAFLLRVIVFMALSYAAHTYGVLTPNPDRFIYPVIGADSGGYKGAAEVLLHEHRFASPGEEEPQSYLMPGYPLLLAVIFFLGGGVASMVVLQAVLAGLSVVLIYRVGKEIAPSVGFVAAWIFVFDPISIFYATTILTETVFIFLTLLAAYLFLRWFGDGWWKMALVGALFGFSVYIRPNAILFPVVCVLVILLFKDTTWNWRDAFLRSAVLVAAAYLVVFPWMLRNKIYFNTWELTAVATIQWYWYNAPLYYAHTHGITHQEALDIFRKRLYEINPHQSDLGTLRNAPYMRQVAFEHLAEDPLGYTWFHLIKSAPFFVSDGLRDIARRMELVGEQPDIGGFILRGDIQGIVSFFKEHALAVVLLVFGVGFWGLVTLGMAVGIFLGKNLSSSGRRALYVSLGLVAVTILIAAGPNANARYRLSVSPFMFLVASYSFGQLREWIKYRKMISHESLILET